MARLNKQNIDRKTNKPNPKKSEGLLNDPILNRANQTRRDDDIVTTPEITLYDVDYAMKYYIENEIKPLVHANHNLIPVPVIYSNGEKWDNVRRLGFIRDEKGKLQSPLIMLKRNSAAERDNNKGLDVNRQVPGNQIIFHAEYNNRNRYNKDLFPNPFQQPKKSQKIYLINIPRYVTVEYEMMLWCDFTTQINDLVDQILPHSRFAWGNEKNRFTTSLGSVTFETVNTIGEDRLVRATVPMTVNAALLTKQEFQNETIRKMFSKKKISWNTKLNNEDEDFTQTST